MSTKSPTKKQLDAAVVDVECSAMANNFSETTLTDYEACAEFAAVDWLNARGLDNSYAATIVKRVMALACDK